MRISRSGSRARSGPFSLFYAPGADPTGSRYAIVVPTSVSKRATVRNRLRRRISEVIRALAASQGTGKVCDGVIRVYPGAEKLSFSEIAEHIEELLTHSV